MARPDSNITGLFLRQIELTVKRLEIVSELHLKTRRVGMLWDRRCVDQLGEARKHAPRLDIDLVPIELRGESYDFRGALAAVSGIRPEILLVGMSPIFFRERVRLFEATNREHLPTVCGQREFGDAGAVVTYGANMSEIYRRAADYVDKLLKGAAPSDLPVEQAAKFELAINLKAAKALGLTIPQSLLLRADEVT